METVERAAAAPSSVGIDLSTTALDVAMRPRAAFWRSPNDEAGITELEGRRRPLAPVLIVLEATGGLERLVVAALPRAGLPRAVVNPRQVRDARHGHRTPGHDGCAGGGGAGALGRGAAPGAAPRACLA